jgi:hypothetical protein
MKFTHQLAQALGAAVLCLVIGCGEKSPPQNPTATNSTSTSGSVLTAPVDYLGAVGKAQQTAAKVTDTASLNQAIQAFKVEHDRFPKDLDELVKEKLLPALPTPPYGTKLTYDAQTGKVKIVKE